MNDLLTVLEVMSYLKVCRATVQRWCKEGKLPAVKIGKEYRIRRSDLERWYESLLKDRDPAEAMAR
jgi:excisionase family DNA binding protein